MDLLQVMHERWAADATLEALCPSARVFIGNYPTDGEPTYPYAMLRLDDDIPEAIANDDLEISVIDVEIIVSVNEDAYAIGRSISDRLRVVAKSGGPFNHAAFDIDTGNVSGMTRGIWQEIQDDETGVWDFFCPFDARVQVNA